LGYGVIGLSVLYLAIFVGRWWEHRRLTSKPHLDFQIHEVYIVPTNNTASCFLRVSIHNEIGAQVANPPSHAYSFRLTIKGKTYTDTSPIDLENYELGIYKQVDAYDSIGYRDSEDMLLTKEPLYRVSTKQDLIPGARVYGWIGFAVHYLPTWSIDRELVGSHVEYDYDFDEEGQNCGRIEETGRLVDDYMETPHSRTVEALSLTMTDAYGQEWIATKLGPFGKLDRRVLKRELSS
jgi:hypothetical protein